MEEVYISWKKDNYTVVGYDKDNDVYIPYTSHKKFEDALEKSKELAKLVKEDKLIRENGEPIDLVCFAEATPKQNEVKDFV